MLIYFKHFRRSFFKKPPQAGFTLVELIVVSAIILIITTFILFQQGKFNSSTLLRSLTYSVALSVRQAQVYGTSVRESSPGSGVFASGYGVYIPSAGGAASDNTYFIFADTNGNGVYDSGEQLPVFTLGKGYMLKSVCGVLVGGTACTSVSSLTVFFRRPNPDACFSTDQARVACAPGQAAVYSAAYITLASSGNSDTRSVKISDTGQIAVCTANIADLTQC